jgi:hypothetical protein
MGPHHSPPATTLSSSCERWLCSLRDRCKRKVRACTQHHFSLCIFAAEVFAQHPQPGWPFMHPSPFPYPSPPTPQSSASSRDPITLLLEQRPPGLVVLQRCLPLARVNLALGQPRLCSLSLRHSSRTRAGTTMPNRCRGLHGATTHDLSPSCLVLNARHSSEEQPRGQQQASDCHSPTAKVNTAGRSSPRSGSCPLRPS